MNKLTITKYLESTMSTYTTDIHRRIQENVSIYRCPHDLSDGTTNQRIIFANENNIYNGTFVGDISAQDAILQHATINNSQINGSNIVDSQLSNVNIFGNVQISSHSGIIDINEIVDDVMQNKTDIQYVSSEISSNNYDISCIQLSIGSLCSTIDDKLSTLSTEFDNKLSTQFDDIEDIISSNVSSILDNINGHLQPKGHINLNESSYYKDNLMLSTIFGLFYHVVEVEGGSYISDVILENGWMYKINTSKPYSTSDDPSYVLEDNDYLIICNHDTNLSTISISSLTPNDIDIIESVYADSFRKSLPNHILCSNTFDNVQIFEEISAIRLSANNLSANYDLHNGSNISIITSVNQANGQISLSAKRLVSSDIGELKGFVDDTAYSLKKYADDSFLPLSGGILIGDLKIDNKNLSIANSNSLYIGENTLCAALSNEITLSTQTTYANLSTALSVGFDLTYNRDTNMLSVVVAGNNKSLDMSKFTEASMLSTVKLYIEASTGNRVLVLYFKTESGISPVSVDLNDIMPLYEGVDGIDISFVDNKYHVAANNTIARLSTINALDAEFYPHRGHMLTAIHQTDGLISAEFDQMLSSDISGLEEYVNHAVSSYVIPLSTSYDWNANPRYYNSIAIEIKERKDIAGNMFATPFVNNEPIAIEKGFNGEYPIVEWNSGDFASGISIDYLSAIRKDDYYILGNNFERPIQRNIDFNSLSILDTYPLSSVNEDSDISTLISAVMSMKEMLTSLRNSIEQIR